MLLESDRIEIQQNTWHDQFIVQAVNNPLKVGESLFFFFKSMHTKDIIL